MFCLLTDPILTSRHLNQVYVQSTPPNLYNPIFHSNQNTSIKYLYINLCLISHISITEIDILLKKGKNKPSISLYMVEGKVQLGQFGARK